jgi:hypothetical protein
MSAQFLQRGAGEFSRQFGIPWLQRLGGEQAEFQVLPLGR